MKTKKGMDAVDVHDERLMVELGIRCPNLRPRDESVWTKTPKEKAKLRKVRGSILLPDMKWPTPDPESKTFGRLTVHIRYDIDKQTGLPYKYNHTTYTHNRCGDQDVEYILGKYKTEHSSIVKAFYCGKEIQVDCI